jgi:hypothetical protein
MRSVGSTAGLAGIAAGVILLACDTSDGTIDPATPPSGPAFRPVAEVLLDRCGTLDCHGSKYRNMRLFGLGSSRVVPTDRPDAPGTTQAEVDRDYESVVALEPDVIRQVVAEGGRDPERLMFLRKARGSEAHKGGEAIGPEDPADACLTSWLKSAIDTGKCVAALPPLRR